MRRVHAAWQNPGHLLPFAVLQQPSVIRRPLFDLFQNSPEIFGGPLAGDIRLVEPAVVEHRTRRSEHHAGGHAERTHSHHRERPWRLFKQIQKPGDISRRFGVRGDFQHICAGIGGLFHQNLQPRARRSFLKIMERGDDSYAGLSRLAQNLRHPAQ